MCLRSVIHAGCLCWDAGCSRTWHRFRPKVLARSLQMLDLFPRTLSHDPSEKPNRCSWNLFNRRCYIWRWCRCSVTSYIGSAGCFSMSAWCLYLWRFLFISGQVWCQQGWPLLFYKVSIQSKIGCTFISIFMSILNEFPPAALLQICVMKGLILCFLYLGITSCSQILIEPIQYIMCQMKCLRFLSCG